MVFKVKSKKTKQSKNSFKVERNEVVIDGKSFKIYQVPPPVDERFTFDRKKKLFSIKKGAEIRDDDLISSNASGRGYRVEVGTGKNKNFFFLVGKHVDQDEFPNTRQFLRLKEKTLRRNYSYFRHGLVTFD